MTGICGIVRFNFKDFKLSSSEVNSQLKNSVKSCNNKSYIWSDENTRLVQGQAKTKIELASDFSKNFIIVADACLTNRTELLEKFGVLPSESSKFTDDYLILKSFEKWGEECVEYLVGDFAFAIWDKQSKKLFCATDHMGGRKFVYYRDNEKFIFANTAQGILNFNEIDKRFNKNKLNYFIQPEPHLFTTDETWFENIYALPAGHILTIDSVGLKTRKYWQPGFVKPLPYRNDDEILEAFREIMFEIIEAPLREYEFVTALLSGGLDSSSIVSVAAKILEKQNKELTVFSSVLGDKNDSQFSDERFYIDQFKSFPNVKIKYISAPDEGPFTDLENFFEEFDSPIITSRHYLFTNFIKAADKINSSKILDGSYGEFGPTYTPVSAFAEMFRNFEWTKLWYELGKRKEIYNESIKYNFRANTLNPFLPDSIKNLRRNNSESNTKLEEENLLQKTFFQKLYNEADIHKFPVGKIHLDHRQSQLADYQFLQQKLSDIPSITFGQMPIEYSYPFLNKKLMDFCLAVPLDLKMRDGYSRYLIRAGLDKILLPKIQWRTSKTPFSPDYLRRYNAQTGQVKQLLDDVKANDPIRELLDIEKIKAWVDLSIDKTQSYTENNKYAYNLVPQAIYLIYFLRKFSEFRL